MSGFCLLSKKGEPNDMEGLDIPPELNQNGNSQEAAPGLNRRQKSSIQNDSELFRAVMRLRGARPESRADV
jgi:hypothetical protein